MPDAPVDRRVHPRPDAAVWMRAGVLADTAATTLERMEIPVRAVGLPAVADARIGLALTDDLSLGPPAGWSGRVLYCVRSLDSQQLVQVLHRADAYVTVIDGLGASLEGAVRATLVGELQLPPTVERSAHHHRALALSAEQLGWFALLAAGWRVIDIATHAGFSERELHRRLHDACRQLQVGSRIEAVVTLARLGLLG